MAGILSPASKILITCKYSFSFDTLFQYYGCGSGSSKGSSKGLLKAGLDIISFVGFDFWEKVNCWLFKIKQRNDYFQSKRQLFKLKCSISDSLTRKGGEREKNEWVSNPSAKKLTSYIIVNSLVASTMNWKEDMIVIYHSRDVHTVPFSIQSYLNYDHT